MDRRASPRGRARGGEGIPSTRATFGAIAPGGGSIAVGVGLAFWLGVVAGPDAVGAVTAVGSLAVACLVVTLAVGRPEPIAGVLGLLGAAYAVILVADDPPLDARAAIVGAALLAVGELAYLSTEARAAMTDEGGGVARRIGWVAATSLVALLVGGMIVAFADVTKTDGLAIEIVGVAAAGGTIGLLVMVVRDAREMKAERE